MRADSQIVSSRSSPEQSCFCPEGNCLRLFAFCKIIRHICTLVCVRAYTCVIAYLRRRCLITPSCLPYIFFSLVHQNFPSQFMQTTFPRTILDPRNDCDYQVKLIAKNALVRTCEFSLKKVKSIYSSFQKFSSWQF